MNKIKKVQSYINTIFDQIPDNEEKRVAYIHSYGVAQCCSLLAQKRCLNAEIATVIGLLHDVYSYKTGVCALHSHNGAEMVRVAFKNELVDSFTDEEQKIIKSAIFHHSDKEHIHDEYDELLKDCDVLQHWLFDASSDEFIGERLTRVANVFSIQLPKVSKQKEKNSKVNYFNQFNLGDIAEKLAEKKIVGERSNADFMQIIKYFPEATAFNELTSAWCAAFVYHCCLEAGIKLPIRTLHTADKVACCRLACVVAWYEWGKEHNFCYYEKDGFIPTRGDIVIYNNIISKENKPENSTWCDHIGIVLSYDNDNLTVAESNVDNKNVSGIVARKRDETIGCYIRIPSDYEYDGWKVDFKTGKIRIIDVIRGETN